MRGLSSQTKGHDGAEGAARRGGDDADHGEQPAGQGAGNPWLRRSGEILLDPDSEAERRWKERLERVCYCLNQEFEWRLDEISVVGSA